jgi:putative transposase
MADIAGEYDIVKKKTEIDNDAIHPLICYPAKLAILRVVKLFKQISTYLLWSGTANQVFLRKHSWKERTFWSHDYFARFIGKTHPQTIKNQG